MLTANSCASALIWGCVLLGVGIFTLQNDIKEIAYQDSLCICRTYFNYASPALFHHSKLLQAIYGYATVVYPHRLFWQSAKCQLSAICLIWIYCWIYPLGFMFSSEMHYIYNVDNQICQLRLRLSFPRIYAVCCVYIIPMSIIMLIYFKLIRYVHGMSNHTTPANTLLRAKRQLKMVQRIVKIITILLILGFPYVLFLLISFFTTPPKYHFRIAYIFIDISMVCVIVVSFQFTDPLKASIMKRIQRSPSTTVPAIT
ncbi:unnamed protein product [Didymodactylos carnosus]|uniref:G-protein coupled receptors family 1 profile domain-containing protein n=1 Tax=Didymodactylos carnosus TaxID=1234261 RepID=A0A8S2MX49_9BILA|nr:unnamed protein product [Didymodactylos carnosus]CAF3977577.1 unnamed protein product [Didymodactylos carnosus]